MKNCAKCQSQNILKLGKSLSKKQRYYCKDCKYCFTRKQLVYGINNKDKLAKM